MCNDLLSSVDENEHQVQFHPAAVENSTPDRPPAWVNAIELGPSVANDADAIEHFTALAQADAASQNQEYTDLARAWRDILEGRLRIKTGFCLAERAYLVLHPVMGSPVPLAPRAALILEHALLGDSQKVSAYDFARSPSAIATLLKETLCKLGVRCSLSRVPLLVAMLAHAANGISSAEGTVRDFEYCGQPHILLGAKLPGLGLSSQLPPAVRIVVSMRLEGRTHAEIAASRRVSRRTVANQMAMAFQRFGVSSRLELARHFATTPSP